MATILLLVASSSATELKSKELAQKRSANDFMLPPWTDPSFQKMQQMPYSNEYFQQPEYFMGQPPMAAMPQLATQNEFQFNINVKQPEQQPHALAVVPPPPQKAKESKDSDDKIMPKPAPTAGVIDLGGDEVEDSRAESKNKARDIEKVQSKIDKLEKSVALEEKKQNKPQSLIKMDTRNSLRNSQNFMQLTKENTKDKFPYFQQEPQQMPPPPFFFNNQ